jgi:hypothetical protein
MTGARHGVRMGVAVTAIGPDSAHPKRKRKTTTGTARVPCGCLSRLPLGNCSLARVSCPVKIVHFRLKPLRNPFLAPACVLVEYLGWGWSQVSMEFWDAA